MQKLYLFTLFLKNKKHTFAAERLLFTTVCVCVSAELRRTDISIDPEVKLNPFITLRSKVGCSVLSKLKSAILQLGFEKYPLKTC